MKLLRVTAKPNQLLSFHCCPHSLSRPWKCRRSPLINTSHKKYYTPSISRTINLFTPIGFGLVFLVTMVVIVMVVPATASSNSSLMVVVGVLVYWLLFMFRRVALPCKQQGHVFPQLSPPRVHGHPVSQTKYPRHANDSLRRTLDN